MTFLLILSEQFWLTPNHKHNLKHNYKYNYKLQNTNYKMMITDSNRRTHTLAG